MKRDTVGAFVLGVAVMFGLTLLMAFTNTGTPARSPSTGGLSSDSIYVMDSSSGGASAGVPNVTGKIPSGTCDGTTALQYDAVTAHAFNCAAVTHAMLTGAANLASVHAATILQGFNSPAAIAASTTARYSFTITTAGTVGGTFNLTIKNNTSSSTVTLLNAQSCTTAAGVLTGTATMPTAAASDAIQFILDTTSCTGVDPIGNGQIFW